MDGLGRFTAVVLPAGKSTWEIDIGGALGPIAVTSVLVRWRSGQAPESLKVSTKTAAAAPWRDGQVVSAPFNDETRILLPCKEVCRLQLTFVRATAS